jgi:hypothetical protein
MEPKSYQMTSIEPIHLFHAHPYHHLLTCPDGDNQWFWVRHLAHVGRAESDLWSGRVRSEENKP